MKKFESLGVQELNEKEKVELQGGAIIRITGVLDGIKKNTRICFFC